MATADATGWTITVRSEPYPVDEAKLAAVAFLARYSGQTLDAYRHDLRNLFQRADDHDLAGLEATRAHLELYRSSMEERGLAASTIDRRLTTACGIYRFAHIDGASLPTRPSTCAVPRFIRASGAAWTEGSWAGSCSPRSGSTIPRPPWPCS